ncbi:hypothetical protein TUM20983_27800 [Mycobacterium antarcticum]|nr:hypothetical protein TUM20983_27800 [Mycolicibacterium sp. TUM20983]GLP83979.1 hypothetical protein TUM20984_53990 [Mycolicibacterium sp. TUM20984]
MIDTNTSEWWKHLCELAANGPKPGEYEDAERFIAQAEQMTAAARALITPTPRTTTPAKWRPPIMRYPATPSAGHPAELRE